MAYVIRIVDATDPHMGYIFPQVDNRGRYIPTAGPKIAFFNSEYQAKDFIKDNNLDTEKHRVEKYVRDSTQGEGFRKASMR